MRKILILPIIISFLFPVSVFGRLTTVDNSLHALGNRGFGPSKVAIGKITPEQRYFDFKDIDRPVFKIHTDIRALPLGTVHHPRKASIVDDIIFQVGEGLLPESLTVAVFSTNGYDPGDWSVGSNIHHSATEEDIIQICKTGSLGGYHFELPERDATWDDITPGIGIGEPLRYQVPTPGAIALGAFGTAIVGWAARRRFQF